MKRLDILKLICDFILHVMNKLSGLLKLFIQTLWIATGIYGELVRLSTIDRRNWNPPTLLCLGIIGASLCFK
jgi:hypothetical protein